MWEHRVAVAAVTGVTRRDGLVSVAADSNAARVAHCHDDNLATSSGSLRSSVVLGKSGLSNRPHRSAARFRP